jgi:hypothetical protein
MTVLLKAQCYAFNGEKQIAKGCFYPSFARHLKGKGTTVLSPVFDSIKMRAGKPKKHLLKT